jgi:hypothetical protein
MKFIYCQKLNKETVLFVFCSYITHLAMELLQGLETSE